MYVTNITVDCDNNTDLNFTNNFTDYEINIDILIPTFFLRVPFSCLMNLMVNRLIKPLKKFK